MKLSHHYIDVNGVTLHVVTSGPRDKPAIFLLHGFPDAAFGWRHQVPALADAGFFVIAPDLRGANLSDKPSTVNAYQLSEFVSDISGIADAFELDSYAVVGHDFGGAVGWLMPGADHRVSHLTLLNAPHPLVTERELMMNPIQQMMSVYIGFLLLPAIPELLIENTDFSFLRACLPRLPEEDVDWYVRSWARPGAVPALINWYRANTSIAPDLLHEIDVPVQIIWGLQDHLLLPEMATLSKAECSDARVEWVDRAGHWVQIDAADTVSEKVIEFIDSSLASDDVERGGSISAR